MLVPGGVDLRDELWRASMAEAPRLMYRKPRKRGAVSLTTP